LRRYALIELKLKKLSPLALIPQYQTSQSAGFDLHSIEDIVLLPGERKLISTGLSFEIPQGYEIQIRPRSGLAYKHGISVLNSPGTIDSDYRGEIKVLLINYSDEEFEIKLGDRIAQAIIQKVIQAQFIEVDSLNNTERGDGGFGSTGV
jgi:dUTP pyrophosphatase